MIFQDDLLFPHLSVGRQHRLRPATDRAGPRARPVWPRSRRSAAWNTCSTGARRRSPAASGSASGWPGRWRPGRGSCSATSRSRPSTCPIATPCIDRLRSGPAGRGIPVLYVTHSPAEAIAWARGSSSWSEGKISPRDRRWTCSSSVRGTSFVHLEGVRNTFPARVEDHSPDHGTTRSSSSAARS